MNICMCVCVFYNGITEICMCEKGSERELDVSILKKVCPPPFQLAFLFGNILWRLLRVGLTTVVVSAVCV